MLFAVSLSLSATVLSVLSEMNSVSGITLYLCIFRFGKRCNLALITSKLLCEISSAIAMIVSIMVAYALILPLVTDNVLK